MDDGHCEVRCGSVCCGAWVTVESISLAGASSSECLTDAGTGQNAGTAAAEAVVAVAPAAVPGASFSAGGAWFAGALSTTVGDGDSGVAAVAVAGSRPSSTVAGACVPSTVAFCCAVSLLLPSTLMLSLPLPLPILLLLLLGLLLLGL